MKRFTTYALAGLMLAGAGSGCRKFDEINSNPDATVAVNSAMLATNVILKNLKFNGRDAMAYLSDNGIAKYVAFANQSIMPTQYYFMYPADFGVMTALPNIQSMLEYAKGSSMENSYIGLAKFMRAYMFYHLTMQVGDIPYKNAGNGATGEIKVRYDAQEEVLKGVLDELKEAEQAFAKGVKFDGDPTPYAGDPAKWRRAVNSFTLKVLMSLSRKADLPSLNVKARFAEIVNGGALLEPATGHLGLNYSTTNVHPMSGTNDLFTSRTLISSILIDNLKRYNDRRLFYFADPAGAKLAAGKPRSDTAAYVGANVSDNYDDLTAAHIKNTYSLINSRYRFETASEPRRLVTYAEQQLVLAEARIRGWIGTGTAKTYYETGVASALANTMAATASYANGMPINQAYINGYFTGEAAFKANPDDQLRQIWMQRYFLNFMIDPFTVFYEYRRNGYPEFPINPVTSLNTNKPTGVPLRWPYPSSEANFNQANLAEALNRQYDGVDDVNKVMWLLR